MIKIYLANLGKYNEGDIVGEWIDLPVSDEELEVIKERIGINERYEETVILDYESDCTELDCSAHDIETLNQFERLITEYDANAVSAGLYFFGQNASIGEIEREIQDMIYIPQDYCSEYESIGRYFAEELDCLDIPEHLENYIDFEAYGRDIAIENNIFIPESSSDDIIVSLAH